MIPTPIDRQTVDSLIAKAGIQDFAHATIREVKQVAAAAEKASGVEFIKMEMGIPGLPAARVGVEAQLKALSNGIANLYPDIQGLPELKQQASRFVKAFINVDISPEGCVPVCGSMQGTFASFLTCSQADKRRKQVQGVAYETFDVYDYRGDKLRPKLESYLEKGNICAIVYSNPNNPSWVCLTDDELRTIGELATQYDAIVMEDLAYFAMDFRQDMSRPFEPPYQPSVAHYTDNYILQATNCSTVTTTTSLQDMRGCLSASCSQRVCSMLCRRERAIRHSMPWRRCSRRLPTATITSATR